MISTTPEKAQEAELMAKHFQWAKCQVMEKQRLRCKSWVLLPVKEKRILADTFLIILAAADNELEKKPLQKVR